MDFEYFYEENKSDGFIGTDIIARENGKDVGLAVLALNTNKKWGRLVAIVTHPDYRSKYDCGSELLTICKQYAKSHGIENLGLDQMRMGDIAKRAKFYVKKNGFTHDLGKMNIIKKIIPNIILKQYRGNDSLIYNLKKIGADKLSKLQSRTGLNKDLMKYM